MKSLEEMSFTEKVDWASGELIVAIGRGEFRSRVSYILNVISTEAYNRGVTDATRNDKN